MTEQGNTIGSTDPLLLPFLRARGKEEEDGPLSDLIRDAQPVIKGIIRNKLKVTLSASDGRLENQEALEIESDVLAELVAELNQLKRAQDEKTINNFRHFAAVVTFHACSRYLRRKNPERGQLKDRLRYLLRNRPHFSLWQTEAGRWLCGFHEWQGQTSPNASDIQISTLLQSSHKELQARDDNGVQPVLDELLSALLKRSGRPVEFDELVDAFAELQGIKSLSQQRTAGEEESATELAQVADTRLSAQAEAEQKFYLRKLWAEILGLPIRQRVALLLNLKDSQGRGMISMFPLTGIATMQEIASALEMELHEFARVWNDLPWEDAMIAGHLKVTRQQVVNLRKCARERLARRMKGF